MARNQLQTDKDKMQEKKITFQTGAFYDEIRREIWEGTSTKDDAKVFLYRVAEEGDYFKGQICLDAGCGRGKVTRNLATLGAKIVYGIEIGDHSINIAKMSTADFKNVIIVKASVLDLPFPDEYFNFVHCSGVLHHTTNPKQGFKELARVTKKGGTLFIAVYGVGGVFPYMISFLRFFSKRLKPQKIFEILSPFSKEKIALASDFLCVPILKRYTEKEIKGWFFSAGFKDVTRTHYERYDHTKLRNKIIHGAGWIQIKGVRN